MKVSVLIPTYNSECFLKECLDSVVGQDFSDMEILISDDQSRDGTLGIIAEFAARDSRIRWWQNPKNLGFVPNHNHCLQQAAGEYVKVVHADDKFLSMAAISKMAAALDANPSAVLTGCEQHVTGARNRPVILSKQSGIYNGRRLAITCWEKNTNLVGQPILTMFRRRAATRGFDLRFSGHLDYEMWFYLLEQGDFYYLAEVLATWRVHETQQTAQNQTSRSANDEHLVMAEIYYDKPWFKNAATSRMLFRQIYELRKKYGQRADALTSAMMKQLAPRHYYQEWLRYKISRPIQKLLQK